MARGKAGEGLFVQHQRSPPAPSGDGGGLAGEAGQVLPQQGIDVEHGQGSGLNFAPSLTPLRAFRVSVG